MLNDFRNEPYDTHDDVRIHRHFKHSGDTVRVQHIALPISLLIEERGQLIRAGHEKLNLITDVASIKCAEPAQARNTGFWSWPFLLLLVEDTPQLLPSSWATFLFVIGQNQETRDEGEWSMRREIVGKGSGGNNEETKRDEIDNDAGDDLVDEGGVVGQSRRRRPRRPQKDMPSRGSITYPGCAPSEVVNRHRPGGRGLKCDKMPFPGYSSRTSSACDQTLGFA